MTLTPAWCLLADTASHTLFRFARLQTMSEWWHWLLLIAICAVVLCYVVVMYWYDSVELSRGVGWSLVLLRLLAFGGILFFFLDLEKRTEQQRDQTVASRTAGRYQSEHGIGGRLVSGDASAPSRIQEVVRELRGGELIRQFRRWHDVAVYQFDEQSDPTPIAFFNRLAARSTRR